MPFEKKKPDLLALPNPAESLVSLDSLSEERYQELARLIREAHTPEMGTVGSAAKAIGISTSALSRVRSGDLKAAGPKTLRKILDFYHISFSDEDLAVARQAPNAKEGRVLAFCPQPRCLTCIYVQLPTGDEDWDWGGRPRILSVPHALFARPEGVLCNECKSALVSACPTCSRPFAGGLFCPLCGSPYTPVDGLPEDFLQERYAQQDSALSYLDRVYPYL